MSDTIREGDLVSRIRRCRTLDPRDQGIIEEEGKYGVVMEKYMGGSNPVHPCLIVLWTKTLKSSHIAESLVETADFRNSKLLELIRKGEIKY